MPSLRSYLPAPAARLTFRRWTAEDLDLAVQLWGDPRVTALIDARTPGREYAENRLRTELERDRKSGVQYWPMFERGTGQHVGCCGLRPHGEVPGEFELGFHLRFEAWGRGYATEAADAVIALAFAEVGAIALIAGHHTDNEPSRRTLTKLGFVYSGHQRYEPTGRDHAYYRLEARRDRTTSR